MHIVQHLVKAWLQPHQLGQPQNLNENTSEVYQKMRRHESYMGRLSYFTGLAIVYNHRWLCMDLLPACEKQGILCPCVFPVHVAVMGLSLTFKSLFVSTNGVAVFTFMFTS